MKLTWTPRAAARLRSIFEYVSDRDRAAAGQLVSRIETAVGRLLGHPALGRPGLKRGTRELVIAGTRYIVVYTVAAAEVRIITIFHSRQNSPIRS